jgi:hypothetical protein
MSTDSGPGQREVAHRLFAAEFDDADLSYSESDEERAPNYVVTPTGARVNRLFAVGVLTSVERVNEDVLRARIVDPTGAFVTYAGQYQPDAMAALDRTESPAFVALTGKARTFQPEDSDRVFTSVRPESVNEVDAETRDRWVVSAAEATLSRVALFAEALAMDVRGDDLRAALAARDVPEPLAAGIPLAIDHYGTTPAYLDAVRRLALDALGVVAGTVEEVDPLSLAPAEGDGGEVGPLPSPSALSTVAADAIGTDAGASDRSPATTESAAGDAPTDGPGSVEPAETSAETETTSAGTEATSAETSAGTAGSSGTATGTTDAESTGSASADAGASGETAASAGSTSEATDEVVGDTGSDALGDFEDEVGEGGAGDALGDFGDADDGEPGDFDDADDGEPGDFDDADDGEPGDFDDADDEGTTAERYELDEDERAELEREYGTEFETGTEVDAAGEADIDVPSADELAEQAESEGPAADSPADAPGSDATPADDADAAPDVAGSGAVGSGGEEADETDETEAGAAGEVDLSAAVVDAMDALDDGDGAAHGDVVSRVVDEHGVDGAAVEEAIQDALMSGKCYEPADGRLKAI